MKLQTKLALLGSGTALLAVIVVALISRRSVTLQVERLTAEDNRESARAAADEIRNWYQQHQSWQGAQPVFDHAATSSRRQLLLLDKNAQCVVASPADLCGEEIHLDSQDRITLRGRSPAMEDFRELIGVPRFLFRDPADSSALRTLYLLPSTTQHVVPARFLDSVGRSLWMGGAVAALAAVLISFFLSRTLLRPVRTLIAVAGRMGKGDLSQRVPVTGRDEIGDLGSAFNAMAESLAQQEQLRKNLFHDVAHELRTPLTRVRCQLESMQDGLAKAGPQALESIHEEVMLLSRLVDDLRDIALAEAGQLRLAIASCDLMAEAGRVVRMATPAAEARGVGISLEGPQSALAQADNLRLAQVLSNLLANAIHHTPSQGTVQLRVRSEDRFVAVEVEDTGTGIAPEHLPHIFERFFRANSSEPRQSDGTGLGLAIVKQLTELQGGSVEVASTLGKGTRFVARLPR